MPWLALPAPNCETAPFRPHRPPHLFCEMHHLNPKSLSNDHMHRVAGAIVDYSDSRLHVSCHALPAAFH